MKRLFGYIAWVVTGIILLLLITVFLLYLPFVQEFLKRKGVEYAASHFGIRVQVEELSVRFPLDLRMRNALAVKNSTDTLLCAGLIHLDVGLRGVWKQQVAVNRLALQRIKLNLGNDTAGVRIRVAVDSLELRADQIDLKGRRVIADELRLADGTVRLNIRPGTASDTTVGKPFDWLFVVKKINLRQVGYRMESLAIPQLVAGAGNIEIDDGEVNIGAQRVAVREVIVRQGGCLLETSPEPLPAKITPEKKLPSSSSWVVEAGVVKVDNSSFRFISDGVAQVDMRLSGIAVRVDSVYNRGTVVRGRLKDLQLTQQNGARVDSMYARVDIDTANTRLQGAYIRTPHSRINLEAHADAALAEMMKEAPLHIRLNGSVGMADLEPFYDKFPEEVRHKQVHLNTSLSLNGDRIAVSGLSILMSGHFSITGKGELSSFRNLPAVSGNIELQGELPDATFVNYFLKGKGIALPKNVHFSCQTNAVKGIVNTFTRICQQEGCATLEGSLRIPEKVYDIQAVLSRFYLSRFIPVDSLGAVTASLRLTGREYSWDRTEAQVAMHIRQLFFKRHNYRRIHLEAGLYRTRLNGLLQSEDPDLLLNLSFKGDSAGNRYVAEMNGAVQTLNLNRLNLVRQEQTVSSDITIRVGAGPEQTYALYAALNNLRVNDGRKDYRLGDVVSELNSDIQKTALDVISGDFSLAFRADSSLPALAGKLKAFGESLQKQMDRKTWSIGRLQQQLPVFTLAMKGAENNALNRFLRTENMGFKEVDLQVESSPEKGVCMISKIKAPYVNKVQLDSVGFNVEQQDSVLHYSLMAVQSTALKDLYCIRLFGTMQDSVLQTTLQQKNSQGDVGFNLGVKLSMSDSTVTARFFPDTLILGYRNWTVNPDNLLMISADRKVTANLHVNQQDRRVDIQSLEDYGDKKERLQVKINRLDLENMLKNVPFVPEISGWLNADLELYTRKNQLGMDGSIKVSDFYYTKQRVGTIDLKMGYLEAEENDDHVVGFTMSLDSVERLVARGNFSTTGSNSGIFVDMHMLSMPLHVVSIFLPPDVLKLDGGLDGNIQISGTAGKPLIQGEMIFRKTDAELIMLGTIFRLDSNRIEIKKNKILFDHYRLIAPNGSVLTATGNVDLGDLSDIRTDLSLTSRRFQLVNVRQNTRSIVYGKAYADIDITMKGAFSALNMAGNIVLLNGTEINYTLRNAGLEVKDKSVDLVRFISFLDTTSMAEDSLVNRLNINKLNLKILVEIGNNVRAIINLSEGGENSVAIQGGGNLIYVMNPESGSSLAGKYTLTGGTVTYNVPVVGKKLFKIQSGSFVEWTGDLLNPELNISASESVRANVVEEGQDSRLVNFESIIRIQQALQRPKITFDLAAPNDIPIQNQLSTFSPEERTKQAMNLLIYNTYTGPGAVSTSDNAANTANNALYGFVENELNRYVRNTGFTFGVDTYNQYSSTGEEVKRTDYTYQYSKHFLNDRINVKVGGRVSTDNSSAEEIEQNLIDDVSIEYVFDKNKNLYLKMFRHSSYESALEGEVTQTGIGVVLRKSFRKVKDLFVRKSKRINQVQGARNGRL